MTLQRLQPEELPRPQTYAQVVVGTVQTMHGQIGHFAGQAQQAYRNLGLALEAAGATPADVTKLTTYVVGYSPLLLPDLGAARRALFGDSLPASTLVGVAHLARPELLIEVEAIAVVG